MPVREILQLGNPTLRVQCAPVKQFGTKTLASLVNDLRDTLDDFKSKNGFGRGIAAPQIGVTERVIFVHIDEPIVLINPVITKRSRKFMTLWDDCFSFPNLLVKVKRNLSIDVRYQDVHGKKHVLKAEDGLSELLQHEIDHVNGILAVDRAIDSRHIIMRSEYERWLKRRTKTF
ncbi:MAG: N-formylmethionyl-tRNA deformylase [Bacteroidetes bacterium]|nr:N-formylmethionyl-tRNA deformylase [Bacteroidota bacterium]